MTDRKEWWLLRGKLLTTIPTHFPEHYPDLYPTLSNPDLRSHSSFLSVIPSVAEGSAVGFGLSGLLASGGPFGVTVLAESNCAAHRISAGGAGENIVDFVSTDRHDAVEAYLLRVHIPL